ncbi:MAG: methyltransferase [Trebonia sp.]
MRMTQLLAGFQVSQALYVAAKLGVSTALAEGPMKIEDLAAAISAQPDSLKRLIRSLAPLGVFYTAGEDTVGVTAFGLTLAAGTPGSVHDAALYWMETHYLPFGDLLHTVQTGEPGAEHHYGQPFFDWIEADPERAVLQNRAMGSAVSVLRAGLFDGYRLPGEEGATVADIGGADGTVLAELLTRDPSRRGIVFDLPSVVQGAHDVIERHGLADRVAAVGGDFFESVPKADIYIVSWILHDWDDESCRRILRSIARTASPGARLVAIEIVVPPGDGPHLSKVGDLVMLGMLSGKERTADEYEALLADAGFSLDRIVSSSSPYSFIEASLR